MPGKPARISGGFAFRGSGLFFGLRRGQLLDSYVSELDSGSVSEQSDVSRGVEESGMVLAVHGIGILLRAVLRDVVSLAGLADIAVEDHTAVDRDRNAVAHGV